MWWNKIFKKKKPRVFTELYPELDYKAQELIKELKELGHDLDGFSMLRTYKEQQKLYNIGRTTQGARVTRARPGQSWHNFGLAIDIVFKSHGAWSWSEKHPWETLGSVGKDLGLTWGGSFRSISDRPHFQITNGLSLKDARLLYTRGGVEAVWAEVSKRS